MNKIKPVYVMHQEGLSDLEEQAVLGGASELIRLADINSIRLINFGVWRQNGYKNSDNSLVPYQSVDWYIQKGIESGRKDRNQLNADIMYFCLLNELWRDENRGGRDHYDILAVTSDIFSYDTHFVVGVAGTGIGTVISTYRFKDLNQDKKYECIKTEIMHELGHVFGMVPANRTENVEESLGKHCTNICIMRQGLTLPTDWINMTYDRLNHEALCPQCKVDLKSYFREN